MAQGKKRVYTLGADGRTPAPIEVTPGASDGVNTEIAATSLTPGRNVIVDVDDVAP